MTSLELWAGVEPSGVRVGDTYADQLEWTGHASRLADIDRIASLGVKAVRYPVLWERTLREDGSFSWSFADERLGRLRELGIRPIVGLVHHGSGPRHTSLLEDSFVGGLADFARAVAERYPWITDYTPVNEPLTTARFSALYGHWYPHAKDVRSFHRALLVECRAIRAAMRAIREVVPGARLIQTEDFQTVSSTAELAYQADFENQRRFLSLDILAGAMTPQQPLHPWLLQNGVDADALEDFVADPCIPDVMGINYYVTSDRFLDHRCELYPPALVGGNGKDTYADVETVRVRGASIAGHRVALELLWQRYRRPLAITEVHIGADSEDQIRWLREAWLAARDAKQSGVDVRAVTLWSAFGCFDWDTLLRVRNGHYEQGAFDIRGPNVRPTALAAVARELATSGDSTHPLLRDVGWWRRVDRLLHPPPDESAPLVRAPCGSSPPVLVVGSCPILLQEIERVCRRRRITFVVVRDPRRDERPGTRACAAIEQYRPWAVIDAASDLDIDAAHAERSHDHVARAARIAGVCHARGIRHVAFSSDLVFDGTKGRAYIETDAVSPFDGYGETKASAERAILGSCPDAIVARTGTLFGHGRPSDLVASTLDAMLDGRSAIAKADDVLSPTYVADAAEATMTLLVDGANGVWHLSPGTALTRTELARSLAALAKVESPACAEGPAEASDVANPRRWRALASERGALLRGLDDALARYVAEWRTRRP